MCQLTQMKDENHTTELDQGIEAGQKVADTVRQYGNWLLSTVNPSPPDEDMWIRPVVHAIPVKYVIVIFQNMTIRLCRPGKRGSTTNSL